MIFKEAKLIQNIVTEFIFKINNQKLIQQEFYTENYKEMK